MSWIDFVMIAPTTIGTMIAVLAIIETFVEPKTRKSQAVWIAAFMVLGIACIGFTVGQQRVIAAQGKLNAAQMQKVSGQLDDLKKLTESKPDESPDKVLAAAAAKILDLDSKLKAQEKRVGQIQERIDWRYIDDSTAQSMVADLRQIGPHTVVVGTLLNNDEANRYANRLLSLV